MTREYVGIHKQGLGATGVEPTPERVSLLNKWAPVIFSTWRRDHDKLALTDEGGVILIFPYSGTDAKCTWLPHARFVELMRADGQPVREPLDLPAYKRVAAVTAHGPRDIAWVLIELPGEPTHIAAVEWELPVTAKA